MENDEDLPSRGYRDYGLSGKIMMGAMVVLFFVVIVMVCVHLYARWYLLRERRRRQRMRHRSRLVLSMDTHNAAPPGPSANRGLDAAVMKSLPIFAYSSKTHPEPIDCSVCLSEFEENEAGRVLPKCNHSFHIDCIDMWFHSHSTCPLCRTPVEAEERPVSSGEVFISISQESLRNEPGSSSGSCSDCKHDMEFPVNRAHPSSLLGTSSFGARKKPLEMASLDIPRRNEGFGRFENESEYNTPVTQSHKSPISRMMSLSFKRILGRERRGGVSPSGNAMISSPVSPPDVERGRDEIERHE